MASMLYLLCTSALLALCGIAYIFQHQLATASRRSINAATALIPTTPLAWGITTITAAFLLLAIGALTALKRTTPTKPA